MYKSKSRTLPCYFGKIADRKYYTGATQLLKNSANTTLLGDGAYWLSKYFEFQAKRLGTVADQVNPGSENIEWQSSGRDKYNPCLHVKSVLVNRPYLTVRNYGSYYYLATWYYRQASYNYTPWFLKDLVLPQLDYQSARANAWWNMQPRFESRVNLLVSLFELKDFRDVCRHIVNYRSVINQIRHSYRKIRNQIYKKGTIPIGDPTAAIASGILINNLALQPMIKDLTNILNQINIIVSEAQQAFQDEGSELQKSHYSEELSRNGVLVRGTGNNAWFGDGEQNHTKFTATLRYTYDYSMRDKFLAWQKYWGLCGSFEAFWNMIPFSFLVDYIVRIGNSIHAMERDRNVNLHQYSYGESLKTSYQKGRITMTDPLLHVLVLDDVLVSGTKADHVLSGLDGSIYWRVPTDPYKGPATPRFHFPNGRQFLNMAALLRCLL